MDYTALIDQFLEYYPEFESISVAKLETTIARALVFISPVTYGKYFYEALYAQVAVFLYSTSFNAQNSSGIVSSRSVSGEYSITFANSTTQSGKFINPYQQILDQINEKIGLGLGMILNIQ